MQRQINMLNLFVEFRFQLFNMITLFYLVAWKSRNDGIRNSEYSEYPEEINK